MWQSARLSILAVLVVLVAPMAQAQDDQSYTYQQVPQGPGPAPGPEQTYSGIGAYTPLTEGMLPVGVDPAVQVQGQTANLPQQTNLGGAVGTIGPYTLGRDDVVQIVVRGQPDFTGQFVIGHDGTIQYGFVGDVKAEGLTKDQLRDVLSEKLKLYVRVPAVNVMIAAFNSKAVYIVGEVARPGKYSMRGDTIKIRDAMIAAGYLADSAALSRIRVIKKASEDPTKEPVEMKMNLKEVLYKGNLEDNIELVNGDIVVVPSTVWSKVKRTVSGVVNPAASTAARAAAF